MIGINIALDLLIECVGPIFGVRLNKPFDRHFMDGLHGAVVRDPAKREHALSLVRSAFNARNVQTHTPVDNPVSLDRENLGRLAAEPYMVAFKADGRRLVLVLTMHEGHETAYLVDRAGEVYSTVVAATRNHFTRGTVIDTEYVVYPKTKEGELLAFNLLVDRGEPLWRKPYTERLEALRKVVPPNRVDPHRRKSFAMMHIMSMVDNLHLLTKHTDKLQYLKQMLRTVTPRYTTDGLVLTAADRGVRSGQDESLLKFKFTQTVDLVVWAEGAAGGWSTPVMTCDSGGEERLVENMRLDREDPAFCRLLEGRRIYCEMLGKPIQFSHILELRCVADGAGGVIGRFVRVRTDKSSPNNVATVSRTIQCLWDNVQVDDLVEMCKRYQAEHQHPQKIRRV